MLHDLRYAFRTMRKNPGFTSVIVLSLALGVGATTTVFSWIQHVLLRNLPGVAHEEQIVALTTTHGQAMWDTTSLPDQKDVARLTDIFSGVIGSQVTPACLTAEGQPFWLYGQIATSNFFEVLGVRPLIGRTFTVDDDSAAGSQPVLVLSETCWRQHFGADPTVIGRPVEVNRQSFTIIGVTPEAFRGTMSGLRCDFWAPVVMHQEVASMGSLNHRTDRWLHTQARLQPGVSRTQAQAAVGTLMAQLEQTYPNENTDIGLRVLPMWGTPYGAQERLLPLLLILFAVSIGVLVIVIANTANLQLTRASVRRREIAIRYATGAGRARIVRQLLTESTMLALFGGVLGYLVASWGTYLLSVFIPETYLPVAMDPRLDGRTLIFCAGVALCSGILFGLVPALQLSHGNTSEALKAGARGAGDGRTHSFVRSAFVVVQVAIALQLLIGAGLCIRSSEKARHIDAGFDPRNVLVAELRIGMNGYDEATGISFYRTLHQRLASTPGIEHAALASWFPLGFEGGPSAGVDVPGYDRQPNEDTTVPYAIVSPGYFATLRIPLLDGRDFVDADDRSAPGAAVVNETMAKRFWPGQNPIGRTFSAWGKTITVVGVAKSGKYRYLNEEPKPFFYVPFTQGVWDLNLGVAVRTSGDPASASSTVRGVVSAIDPGVAVWVTMPMPTFIGAAYFAQDTAARLNISLGIVALLLSVLGIYGVTAYVVGQRTREIGVRMALGAVPGDIRTLILGGGLRLVLIGFALGLAGSYAINHLLAGFLPGLSPYDTTTYAAALLAVGTAAILACWLPVRRAIRVDPLVALRTE